MGLAIGSFINVVATRVPVHLSIMRPPSRCPRCLHRIRPHENIPVFSYLVLRGRCSACGERIPVRYPATELITALAFVLVTWHFGGSSYWLWLLPLAVWFTGSLVAISATDLEFKRIPTKVVYVSLAGAVLLAVPGVLAQHRPGALGVGALSALAVSGGLRVVHELNPKWMGFGDVRLGIVLGFVLGVFGVTFVITGVALAFVYGTVIGLLLIAFGRERFGRAVPFGPYLALGAYTALLSGPLIWHWYTSMVFRS